MVMFNVAEEKGVGSPDYDGTLELQSPNQSAWL